LSEQKQEWNTFVMQYEFIFSAHAVTQLLSIQFVFIQNKSDISYLKSQPGLRTFQSTQELSWQSFSVSSVGITNSCSLLAFLLSVSLASSHLRGLCFLVSRTRRLLILTIPVLKAAIRSQLK